MRIPPIFMILRLCLRIQFIFPMKNDNTKNGTAKPSAYADIYMTPDPGFVAASPNTIPRIGPVHGVQPAANAIPTNIVPINPAGRFLNSKRRSFIKNSGVNTPAITNPKRTINIAPTCLISS